MLFSAGKCKADTIKMWAFTCTNDVWICSWADLHITCTTFFGTLVFKVSQILYSHVINGNDLAYTLT